MTKSKIQEAINKLPQLTAFGIGIYNDGKNLSEVERNDEFQKNQAELLESFDEFEKTCEWLKQIDKIKSINPNHSSYGLKDIAERKIGYISNGVFIAAAIYSGFTFKQRAGNPNVSFNMSERSIKLVSQ